jgi:Integrase core domain
METEAQLIVQRASLRWLAQQHPSWTQQDLATALGKSLAWVKKWLKRVGEAKPTDVMVLHARSRARKTPPASIISQTAVVQRILEMRESPPENLHRVPGPEAILYYLHRDPALQKAGVRLPRSQTTIWKILRLFGCIAQEHRRKPKPLERKHPGEEVQLDLKDATTVPADPEGKRQHVVEITNFVDAGTSIWLSRSVGGDFDAESLLEVVAQFLRERGLPTMLTFDNDPRFVGSASGRDFPSALLRMLLCVGVEPNVCPPHRPDKNAYVERFHRTLGEECLRVQLPRTLEQVQETTESFLHHYNEERPNQARSCGNQPPRVACPTFPPLPAVPETIDPDRWLERVNGQAFVRKVQADASVTINHEPYYVPRELAGQQVTCFINAPEKQFEIWQAGLHIKSVPIKGLFGKTMPFDEYVELMKQEARSEYRRYLQTHPTLIQGHLWT